MKTPLQSIRKYCLECMNGSATEVKLCPSEDCEFYKFRLQEGRPKLKDIRNKCKDCGEGTWKAIKDCEFPECPIYNYRLGKNPNRTGIGRKGGNPFLARKH